MKHLSRFFDNRTTSSRLDLIDSIWIGVALTALSYIVGRLANWGGVGINWLEIFAVATSYTCTYLCVKERRINYPIGAASTAAYTILFLQSHLYASAVLNAYLTPALIYGWFRWRQDRETRPVRHVQLKWIPAYVLVTAAAYYLAAEISTALGGTLAWTDSAILAGSILAQFLLDNKKLENWYVWLVVDGIAIYEYFHTGLYLVGFQYAFFFLNTLYGLYVWGRSMHDDRVRIDDSDAADNGALAADPIR